MFISADVSLMYPCVFMVSRFDMVGVCSRRNKISHKICKFVLFISSDNDVLNSFVWLIGFRAVIF